MGNESLKVLENSLNFLFLKGYEPCGTVERRFNEHPYSEVLDITNDIPSPNNSKIDGKEPQYNETSL